MTLDLYEIIDGKLTLVSKCLIAGVEWIEEEMETTEREIINELDD